MTPGVDSISRHVGAINKLQNGEQKLGWNVDIYLLIFIYINGWQLAKMKKSIPDMSQS